MKNKFSYLTWVWLLPLLYSCESKLTTFEIVGDTSAPAPISMSTVRSEALPGEIKLTWDAPEGNFTYLQIRYYDPHLKKDVYKIASKGTTEMVIEDTRARYGDYTFHFQTFNAAHQGGETGTVNAQSGPAPATTTVVSRTEIPLTADMLSTNAQEPSEGPIRNLIDKDPGTFFHTIWSGAAVPLPQYIQVDLKEPYENFLIWYQNRNDNTTDGRPSTADLQISNDGQNWETVAELSGLPSARSAEYTSDYVAPGKTFTHFRFSVTSISNGKTWFNMAELALYDVELAIFDPETDEE
ncbi:MAG: discoidin domain-containing protein [Bacteroides sp.]|nr:discoidin domain-containing protein [Bacteroides sp.]